MFSLNKNKAPPRLVGLSRVGFSNTRFRQGKRIPLCDKYDGCAVIFIANKNQSPSPFCGEGLGWGASLSKMPALQTPSLESPLTGEGVGPRVKLRLRLFIPQAVLGRLTFGRAFGRRYRDVLSRLVMTRSAAGTTSTSAGV